MFWDIVQVLFNVFVTAIWTSFLLLVFTLTSSPYNSRQSATVLRAPNKSPRKDSFGLMPFDDGNVANAENGDERKSDDKNDIKGRKINQKAIDSMNNDANYKVNSNKKRKYKIRKQLRNSFRMFFTWLYIIPVFFASSFICNFFQLLARISHPLFNYRTRMWLSSWFAARWFPVSVFAFEMWPNVTYRIHNMNPQEFKLARKKNVILIGNHAQSPFDWVAGLSFSDSLGRASRSYSIMKRLFLFIPAIGWTAALSGSLAMHRNWEADKKRLKALFANMKNDYARPWFLLLYPEGTRQTPKKLKAAQDFARSRGYAVLDNLLQPRVKGFTFFCQELGHAAQAVDYIIDMTTLYIPKPPPMKRYALSGRLHDRLDMILRVYKISDMPKEKAELDQWLRDRWTEKDKLIDQMKNDEIDYLVFPRNAMSSSLHYAFYVTFFAFIFYYLLKIRALYCMLWLITALFPILIMLIERSNDQLHEFLLSAELNLSKLVGGGGKIVSGGVRTLQDKGSTMKYNMKYSDRSGKVQKLSNSDFVSLEGPNEQASAGIDVESDDDMFNPQMSSSNSNRLKHRNKNVDSAR